MHRWVDVLFLAHALRVGVSLFKVEVITIVTFFYQETILLLLIIIMWSASSPLLLRAAAWSRLTTRIVGGSAALRPLSTKPVPAPPAAAAAKAPAAAAPATDSGLSPVTEQRQSMTKFDRHMLWGQTGQPAPPVLPDDPSEIASLDPADLTHRTNLYGETRTVVIRQQQKSSRQAPLNPESVWRIYFYEDGTSAERWTNSLMGWTSNADPYQFNPPITFENAQEAVYFAKKRGWRYVVKQPILRHFRRDDAQYQDNFLPQAVLNQVQRQGVACTEWRRDSAGTSHYFRPLKYHGNGVVPQHGPTGTAKTEPHVAGYYKAR